MLRQSRDGDAPPSALVWLVRAVLAIAACVFGVMLLVVALSGPNASDLELIALTSMIGVGAFLAHVILSAIQRR